MKTRIPIALLLALSPPALAQFDPPVATDTNPDPTIVEVDLEASETTWQYLPGVDTTVYAFNGSIPGPTIEANIGDTLIVHFTNNLPEPTTVHWHGVETPANMDGAHIAQQWIQPGATFDYQFEILRDGLFWYHPHVRTFDQVEKGLYGALLFRDPVKEQALGLDTIEEHIVMFDDVLLDDDGLLVPAFSFTDPVENALYHLNGREGNHLLVNGKLAATVDLPVSNGEPQRWRCVNAANTTICRLNLNDPAGGNLGAQLWEIGNDSGFLESPFPRNEVTVTSAGTEHPNQALLAEMSQGILLWPGERSDIVFTPIGDDGETFVIKQWDWFRGRHNATQPGGVGTPIMLGDDPLDGLYGPFDYFSITLQGPDPGTGEYMPPDPLTTFPPQPGPSVSKIPVSFGHGSPDPNTGDVTLFAQVDSSGNPLPTPLITSRFAPDVLVDQTYTWEVTNLSHGDHPFHAHGFFFELLEYEFQDDLDPLLNFSFFPQRRIIKDTIRVPARLGAKGSSRTIARLLTRFDDTGREGQVAAHGETATEDINGDITSGGWLFHCHVLEHSAKGMLSFVELRDLANDPFALLGHHLDGTNGKPSLTARGDLSPGSTVNFDLVNALPGAQVVLVGGTMAASFPFNGGTVVPAPQAFFADFADGQGRFTWDITAWDNFPSGTLFFFQVGIMDPGGPMNWALSNAVRFRKP